MSHPEPCAMRLDDCAIEICKDTNLCTKCCGHETDSAWTYLSELRRRILTLSEARTGLRQYIRSRKRWQLQTLDAIELYLSRKGL